MWFGIPVQHILTTQLNRIIKFTISHSYHNVLFHFIYSSETWAETVTHISTEHTPLVSVSHMLRHQAPAPSIAYH